MEFQLRKGVPRTTMHGLIYQQYLLRLALHRGLEFNEFELWSEVDKHGVLDDIVFKTDGEGGMTELVCIQVKHSNNGTGTIRNKDLLPRSEGKDKPFSVRRLFLAYVLWHDYAFSNGYTLYPALYTNWDLDFQDTPPTNTFKFRRLNELEVPVTLRKLLWVPSELHAQAFVIDNPERHDLLNLEVIRSTIPHYEEYKTVIDALPTRRIVALKKKFLKTFVFLVNQGGAKRIYETILQEIEMKLRHFSEHLHVHRAPSSLFAHSILNLIHFHSDLPDIGSQIKRSRLYLNEDCAKFALNEIRDNVCKIYIEGLSQVFFDTTSTSLVDPDPIYPKFQDRQWVYNDLPIGPAMWMIKLMYSDCLFIPEKTFIKIYRSFNVLSIFKKCDVRYLALVRLETVEDQGLQGVISPLLTNVQNLKIIFIRHQP